MLFEKIRGMICEQFAIEEGEVGEDTSFVDDLGADSLDVVELTMTLEEEFGMPEVPEEDLKVIMTVGDLVKYVSQFVED